MKVFLSIFWFALNAFVSNAVPNHYVQKQLTCDTSKNAFWKQTQSQNSTENNVCFFCLTEELEETIDEGEEDQLDSFFLDTLSFAGRIFQATPKNTSTASFAYYYLFSSKCPQKALFLRFCNLRI